MARQETILSVFVASPDDVKKERNILEDVINEINLTLSRDLKVRIELIKWETHAYPSFGKDVQDTINNQIPNDFDIFIGIMWHRFGTPTPRYGSGTFEEFQNAKYRFDIDPNSIQLMLYFKELPPNIDNLNIDQNQLDKVNNFKAGLGQIGGLYWSYKNQDEFGKLVRRHLTRYLQKFASKVNTNLVNSQQISGNDVIFKNVLLGLGVKENEVIKKLMNYALVIKIENGLYKDNWVPFFIENNLVDHKDFNISGNNRDVWISIKHNVRELILKSPELYNKFK